jgi:hypothetical protein
VIAERHGFSLALVKRLAILPRLRPDVLRNRVANLPTLASYRQKKPGHNSHHLTAEEIETLRRMTHAGASAKEIAGRLGRSIGCIYDAASLRRISLRVREAA